MITVKLEPKITVRPLELTTVGNTNKNAVEYFNERYGSNLSLIGKEPVVFYNGITIPTGSIISFYLDNRDFIPVLNIYFKDQSDMMISNTFALDNTIISIFIDSRTKDENMVSDLSNIRMDFKLVEYSYDDEEGIFFIKGVPDIDDLYVQKLKSYPKMTSYNALLEVAKDSKIGFSSNIDDSSDSMTWMNPNIENFQFIEDVTERSYKSDNSFFTSFIDYNYNLNFIDVEKALQESLDIDAIYTYANEGINESNTKTIDKLFIVNSKHYDSKYNNLYESFEIVNKSTRISINNGYRKIVHYYDKTGNWDQRAGAFFRFNLETNTDNRGISMKSFPDDTKDDGFFKKNIKNVYDSPVDIDNVHKNFVIAKYINTYNNEELNKVMIKVTMREPNFNLYKYQKIKTVVMKILSSGESAVNERLSGGWLIRAINFYYEPEIGLKQELFMTKRELSVDDFEF